MSMTWRKWFVGTLAIALAATLFGGLAIAGKPAKPPKEDDEPPPGTIFFWTPAEGGLLGMDGDGNNMYEAAPTNARPSHFIYGEDDHRWFLTLNGNGPGGPFPFGEFYPDGDPRWEVAVLRPDPSLPFGGEWIQLTDLYAPSEEDPFNIVEMLCATHDQLARPTPRMVWGRNDEFVSFLGVDWRQWPNPTQGIFRIPITTLEIELLREDTPLRSFDDLETVVTIPNSHDFESFAWSPLGDRVAYSVTDYPDPSKLYIRTVDGSEPDWLVWEAMQGYRLGCLDWSPDGTRLVFLTTLEQPSIVTIDVTGENPQPTVVAEGHQYRRAVWSPDSQYLALTIVEWQGKYVYSIGRVSAAGGRVKKLTNTKPNWREVFRWTP